MVPNTSRVGLPPPSDLSGNSFKGSPEACFLSELESRPFTRNSHHTSSTVPSIILQALEILL